MPFIDGDGRIFGRLNIVDAAVLLTVGLLIPLMYGTYLLFSPPLPRLIGVDPARVAPGTTRIKVIGEHLRPNLRIAIGDIGARLLLADSENGIVEFPLLAPGVYDVRLFDGGQHVSALPKALTVPGPPAVDLSPMTQSHLIAIGTFNGLDSTWAQRIWKLLSSLEQSGTRAWSVVAVEPPEPNVTFVEPLKLFVTDEHSQIKAALGFRCVIVGQSCMAFGTSLEPHALIYLPLPEGDATAVFRVDQVHPVYTDVLQLTLRGALTAGELAMAREHLRSDRPRTIASPYEPELESLGPVTPMKQDYEVELHVRVPAISTATGWMHRDRVLRTHDGFGIVNGSLQISGLITEINPPFPRTR